MNKTQTGQAKVVIAFVAFGRDGRLVPKRKIVTASKLEKTLEKLGEEGAMNIAVSNDAG
jgi:hypothetical protein